MAPSGPVIGMLCCPLRPADHSAGEQLERSIQMDRIGEVHQFGSAQRFCCRTALQNTDVEHLAIFVGYALNLIHNVVLSHPVASPQ